MSSEGREEARVRRREEEEVSSEEEGRGLEVVVRLGTLLELELALVGAGTMAAVASEGG